MAINCRKFFIIKFQWCFKRWESRHQRFQIQLEIYIWFHSKKVTMEDFVMNEETKCSWILRFFYVRLHEKVSERETPNKTFCRLGSEVKRSEERKQKQEKIRLFVVKKKICEREPFVDLSIHGGKIILFTISKLRSTMS